MSGCEIISEWLERNPNPNPVSSSQSVTLLSIDSCEFTDNNLSPTIGALEGLEGLFIRGMKLNGPIPAEFNGLKELQSLTLSNLNLAGQLPDYLGQFKKLQSIELDSNSFTGSIPQSWSNLDGLDTLNLGGNPLLNGSFPTKSLMPLSTKCDIPKGFLFECRLISRRSLF